MPTASRSAPLGVIARDEGAELAGTTPTASGAGAAQQQHVRPAGTRQQDLSIIPAAAVRSTVPVDPIAASSNAASTMKAPR